VTTCFFLCLSAAAAPAPDQRPDDILQALERQFRDERVKARNDLAEKEEALREAEGELGPPLLKSAERVRSLEKDLERIDPNGPGAVTAAKMQQEINQARAEAAGWRQKLRQLKQDVVAAEEDLRMLEKLQDAKRRRVYAELGIPEGDGRPPGVGKKLDAILRELEGLRRDLKSPSKEP
jgi:hypothetical protein